MRNIFHRERSPGITPDHMRLDPQPALSLEVLAALAIAFLVVMLFTL